MAFYLFSNNAQTTAAGAINAAATSVTVSAGSGAEFPSPVGGQIFTLTFIDATTGLITEITHCTARVGDVLTIVRAQEGTTALDWPAGSTVANFMTAGTARGFAQDGAASAARLAFYGSI